MLKRTRVQHRGIVLVLSAFVGSLFLLGTAFASARFDPARWLRSRPSEAIVGQSRTVLPDGTLLFLGGEGRNGMLATATIENPLTGELKTLPHSLHHPRAGHTATVLPNGTVLVFGGIRNSGEIEGISESFDPTTEKFLDLPSNGLSLRAYHSATILTDGDLLVAGGVSSSGTTIGSMEIWHFETNTVTQVALDMLLPRSKQTAILLADGTVLLWGGFDQHGTALNFGEVFNPKTNHTRLETTPLQTLDKTQSLQLETSLPEDKSTDVPVGTFAALRFSEPLNPATVNRRTITLSGPLGLIDTNVVAAEAGMLAFITPQEALPAGTTFTLIVDGAVDSKGISIPRVLVAFTTMNPTAGSVSPVARNLGDGDLWVPGASNFEGNWKSGQGQSPMQKLPSLEAGPGVTALAGQALRVNGLPLEGVSLQVDDKKAQTDATGRFLLANLTAGHHALLIDGTTASKPGRTYGIFQVGVDLKAGQTTALTYTIWMTRLDMAHAVTIPSPTTTETIVSTPLLPGLELHLAPNTVIRDRTGKIVTKISITAVPIDQPPFPLPPGVAVPIYFTIQPGDAYLGTESGYLAQGARLFYPNAHNAPPRTQFNFWNYDAKQKGWYIYGVGTVSTNGKQIVPGPGVAIYEFTGAMVGSGAVQKALGPTAYPPPRAGEPVDLSSGLFVYTKTDLSLPDVIPLVLQRTYTSNDSVSRTFGIGAMQDYDIFISGNTNPYTFQELMLPDGARLHFQNYAADGGSFIPDADFVHTASQTIWYGATITWNNATGSGWVLTRRDGMKYFFPEALGASNPGLMAVTGIQDRYGNTVEIDRDAVGNITKVSSPNGRYVSFQHDTSNRVTQAQDNLGRIVSYVYDPTGRLSTVTDANSGVTTYTYDSNNNMLTIKDPRGIVYLTNQYDGNNRISQQTLGDGGIYKFAWTSGTSSVLTFSESNNLPSGGSAAAVIGFRTSTTTYEGYLPLVSEVQVTDPRGVVRDVKFNSTGQMTSDAYALGKPEQQAFTYAYYADNLIQSVTDQLARVTAFQYDANGNTTEVTRLSGTSGAVSTSFSYDPNFSQLTSVTDPLNNATSIILDNSGNPQTITDPLTHQTTMTFNPAGQTLTVMDALNNKTQFGYVAGDLTSITDPLNRITNRFTDSAGRVASMTDPAGDLTKFSYNPLNQPLTATNPIGGATSFTYDGNGNLLTVKDANNHTTTYTYENMDRVATRKDGLNRSESYQYDTNGNLTQFTDRRGKVTTYTYDNLNRRLFAGFGTQVGPIYESTINYTWDGGSRLTKIVDSVTGTITRGYDGLDRLTSEQTPQGTVSYTYDTASRRQTMTVAGQTALNYTFDNANRLTKIAQGTATVQLGYDNANRRTSLTLANGIVTNYGYDNASELTGLTYKLNSTTLGTLTYSYDMAGRRTTVGGTYARTGLPSAQSTTSYDAANELTKWGTATPTFDANGNVLSDGTNTYVWNGRNQLASMNMSAQSFQYDPLGRRVAKTILGTTTNYLYDGINSVQELAGSTVTANLITGAVDEYFQRTDSTGAASFLTDALGSSVALTNSTGSNVAQYTYEAFGNTTITGSSSSTYQYTGRENDGTGAYYYRARYYSPTLQRFVSEDPIGFYGGTNFYAYVNDSASNLIDPLGLSAMTGRNCANKACRDYFLRNAYGPVGNLLADKAVPEFSVVSLVTNFTDFAKGSGLTLATKGLVAGGPWLYGKMLTTTGNNLMAYPGLAGASADALETGAFWTTTGVTLGSIITVGGTAITAFSTTADLYARWECIDVH